jgi:hypothetical protein
LTSARPGKEERDFLLDKPLAVAVIVFNLHPKAVEKLDVGDAGFFPDLACGGLLFILADLNVSLWEIPVAGGVMQKKKFRLGCAFLIEHHCASGPLVCQWLEIDLVVCKFFAVSVFIMVSLHLFFLRECGRRIVVYVKPFFLRHPVAAVPLLLLLVKIAVLRHCFT